LIELLMKTQGGVLHSLN